MGIRSDIGVAIKHSVLEKLPEEATKIFDDAQYRFSNNEGTLFYFTSTKWYKDDPEIQALYAGLAELPEEDYRIVEACQEYPESDDGDAGEWEDPWGLCREISVTIEFDGKAE